jgi:hypothetical protein
LYAKGIRIPRSVRQRGVITLSFLRNEEVVGSNPATPTEVRGHIQSMGMRSLLFWVTN